MTKLKAYLAAPIFNRQQLDTVQWLDLQLKNTGHYEVFSPYEASREIWKGRAPKDCLPVERAEVLRQNVERLRWCDLLVAWLGGTEDGKTDTGVVWEMGFAAALTKGPPAMYEGEAECAPYVASKPFTLGYIHPTDRRQGRDINLMLAGTVDAVATGADITKALDDFRAGALWCHQQWHPTNLLQQEEAPIT